MRARLLRTTALRLALRYAVLYVVILVLVVLAFTWVTRQYADTRIEQVLLEKVDELRAVQARGGRQALIAALAAMAEEETKGSENEQAENGESGLYYLLLDASGATIAGNLAEAPLDDDEAPEPGEVASVWIEEEILPHGAFDDDAYLPLTTIAFDDGSRLWLAWGVEQLEELHELTEYLIEVLPAAIVLSLLMSVSLGRNILQRVEVISDGAGEIMAGDLASRIPVSQRNDEFDSLALRLNDMLDRIQRLVRGLSEVTDNIAHDLRSPLTRIRNRLEVTLLENRREEEYRSAMQQSIEDADALIRTFNALLGIAQAEAGSRRAVWTRVDLSSLARDLADLYEPLAQEQGQHFVLSAEDDAWMLGSRHLLAQAIGNLLDNAIKFTPEGGTIRFEVEAGDGKVHVRVADTGPGISEEDWPRAQERFVRLDQSRHLPGSGLGLSLVRAVCRLHGGKMERSDADSGLVITLTFDKYPDGDNNDVSKTA